MSRVRTLAIAGGTLLMTLAIGVGASQADEPVPTPDLTTPQLTIHEAPTSLTLREDGRVRLKASAPAAPGDPVYLNTAGAYNTGYVRVDEAVLGKDLTATLRVPGREFLGTFDYWATIPASGTYQEGVSARFPIEIVSPAPQVNPSCGGAKPKKADGAAWVCTFNDEFNGPELDGRYWIPQETENSGFTTGTRLKYACAWDSRETIDVREGNLELSLIDLGETRDCGQNKSSQFAYGQVMHYQTYAQTYGRYEVRAKIPDLRVPGSQQSFWLWPEKNTYGPWPASGELDFAEMYSSAPGVVKPFMHYLPGPPTESPHSNVTHAECPIKVGQYNTYTMEWGPSRVTILVNGQVCMINDYSSLVASSDSPAPFDHPFFLALNQAMGTIGNEYDADLVPDTLTTQIDYVRVWR
ncbi:glycoside hydrolase family 16 protein [Methylocystis sp.]|uniref:glycoside hydrolase family 16 protein n=1 Tax=Methylocystis sp. TaxID=1911079 RepID=UPI003DA618E7